MNVIIIKILHGIEIDSRWIEFFVKLTSQGPITVDQPWDPGDFDLMGHAEGDKMGWLAVTNIVFVFWEERKRRDGILYEEGK